MLNLNSGLDGAKSGPETVGAAKSRLTGTHREPGARRGGDRFRPGDGGGAGRRELTGARGIAMAFIPLPDAAIEYIFRWLGCPNGNDCSST